MISDKAHPSDGPNFNVIHDEIVLEEATDSLRNDCTHQLIQALAKIGQGFCSFANPSTPCVLCAP